jgi:hypothetical protein
MSIKKLLEKQIRGWFPQEPLPKNFTVNTSPAPKTKAELDKKLFKNGWIANSIITVFFLGVHTFLIQPAYNYHVSAEVTIIALGVFLSALAGINLLLYWCYRKQLQSMRWR